MPFHPAPGTDRLRYFEGSLLASRDLNDDVAFEGRMRGLHVTALHGTSGVALGLSVLPSADRHSALVTAGLAYDGHAAEILLPVSLQLEAPLPPTPLPDSRAVFDLVIRAAVDEASVVRPAGPGRDRSAGWPRPRWVFAGGETADSAAVPRGRDVRLGEDVPLARFRISSDGTLDGPDLTRRVSARPLLRPHIFSDSVEPGLLTWATESRLMAFSLVATVDTSAAGFSVTPYYVADLPARPTLDEAGNLAVGPFLSLFDQRPTSFGIRLLFGFRDSEDVHDQALQRWARKATVSWTGVEPFTGSAPDLASAGVFTRNGLLLRNATALFPQLLRHELAISRGGGHL
jgi:hypothetical protein